MAVIASDIMPCYNPISVRNKRSSSLNRHGRTFYQLVPCGKCLGCLKVRQMQYAFRMEWEAKDISNKCIYFCTFTYAPEFLPPDNELSKLEVQHYIRRLKKYIPNVRVRYVFCGEHGSFEFTERAHYHAILFFSDYVSMSIIAKAWPFGIVDIAEPSLQRFGYVAKYSVKQLGDGSEKWRQPPFLLISNSVGFHFLEVHGDYVRKNYINSWINASGFPVLLPRIFMERLFPPLDKVHMEKRHSSSAAESYYSAFVGNKYVLDFKRKTRYDARVSVQSSKRGLSVPAYEAFVGLGNSFVNQNKVQSIFNRVKYETGRYSVGS